jgi:Glycosyl transferase family 2
LKLSILLPTHRHSLLACSRIAQACSWAGPNIEVIVRDNSGDARKRELLTHFQRENCKVITADPCEPRENFSKILGIATGDFIFCLGDDDFCFDHAVADLPDLIGRVGDDPSIVGITGTYAVETSTATSIASYQHIDSDDARSRVAGLLEYPGPNLLYYSVMRRELVHRISGLMNEMPFSFSFHDQIFCLLYLLNGKFVRLQRLMYLYDMGLWESRETAQKRDLDFYKDAGLDPAINRLHWIFCGFEGASLVMNSDMVAMLPPAERQSIADLWFTVMFTRFKRDDRFAFGSPRSEDAERWCKNLQESSGRLTFENILAEICNFIALSSKNAAQDYFDFWGAVIKKRQPPPRRSDVPRRPAVNEF